MYMPIYCIKLSSNLKKIQKNVVLLKKFIILPTVILN